MWSKERGAPNAGPTCVGWVVSRPRDGWVGVRCVFHSQVCSFIYVVRKGQGMCQPAAGWCHHLQ